ncbi:MAG: polysaccharide deacetylase family protein, partial [Alphaproteobacteria bacterium]|nr:polysaccharide deacetylase family protein [Alphaproteobacteria bacterium]
MIKKGIIWGFHCIEPDSHKTTVSNLYRGLTVSPDYLEKLILFAQKQGYQFVSMSQFLKDKADNKEHKNIVITIDDGWRNVYTYAYPIFKKYRIPFVFYIATDLIENGFKYCKLPEMDGMTLLCDYVQKMPISDSEKPKQFKKLWKKFKYLKRFLFWLNGHQIISFLCPKEKLNFKQYHCENACSMVELKDMLDSGLCEIGSHSAHHVHMDRIKKGNKENELIESQQLLEKWLGIPCVHFSYPYGHHD